jgi:hypothetical protein
MGATSVMRMGGQHSPETGHRLANQARYVVFFPQPVACVYLTTLFFRGKLRSMD